MAQITAALTNPQFWLLLMAAALLLGLLAALLRIRWWPAWLLRVLLAGLALAGLVSLNLPQGGAPAAQRQVMIVDQSDSLDEDARRWALEQAALWQSAAGEAADEGPQERMVVVFGAQPQAALPALPEDGADAGGSALALAQVNGRASDLSAALRLGGELLGEEPGRLVLLSDGLAGDPIAAEQAAADLAAAGHTLDAVPLAGRDPAGDLAVSALSAPRSLWAGTGFDLLAAVHGSPARLLLTINDSPVDIPAETAAPGLYRFRVPPLAEGSATLAVSAQPPDGAADPFPENNTAYTVLRVFAPPRVLFVTGRGDSPGAAAFTRMLIEQGVQVETAPARNLPTNLDSLDRYQVIFLDDLNASSLNFEQMQALQVFVSRMAGGLVVLGGSNSYTLGGYQGSPLEPMLPVQMEPPPRIQRIPIAFQLVLDRSSSMRIGTTAFSDLRPIDLAIEAAIRSIEQLRPEDHLGVITFSDTPVEDVPLALIGDEAGLRDALEAVSQVQAMGTTRMLDAVVLALDNLAGLPEDAPVDRYLLILSDGQSTDGSHEQFLQLAETANDQGIIVSTIALGPGADENLLEQMAAAGGGRFYSVRDPGQLPRVMLSESQAARSENIQAGVTTVRPGDAGHPILSGIDPAALPALDEYNALRSKAEEGAEDVLVSSSFSDPLLSAWQYGLGRVVAWMGDIEAGWAGSDTAGDGSPLGLFWSQVVRYALVDPALDPAQVQVTAQPDHLAVEASIYTLEGQPLNLAEVTFTYAGADGERRTFRLPQRSPGGYRAELPLPPEGAYRAVLSYTAGGETIDLPAAFAVNPPAEWLPAAPDAGRDRLAGLASAGGGSLISAEAWGQAAAEDPQQPIAAPDGWWYLLLALVILWPLEIAIRRRWLPWR